MRPEEIPYDVRYTFDADLREVPVDAESMAKAIVWLKGLLPSDADQSSICSLLGVYCRIMRREDEAEGYLLEALRSIDPSAPRAFVARIRLAHVYHWQRCFDEAETLFHALLQESQTHESLRGYLDFVYQHFGKCFFDQGIYGKAQEYFQRALEIRRERGAAQELIESSTTALTEAGRRGRSNLATSQ